MMEDLFSNVDLDLDLMGVDSGADDNLGFLPEDLFNFIDEDLKDIENGAIPDIESLINFEDDDQFADDDIQWDFDLDTTDFFKNTAQEQQQQQQSVKFEQSVSPAGQPKSAKQSNKSNANSTSKSKQTSRSFSKSCNKSCSKSSKTKKSKQTPVVSLVDQNVASPTSTGYSTPNSPQSAYSSNSSDSNDFLDMFPAYYSYDDNNLVGHPVAELSMDELNELSNSLRQQPQSYDSWSDGMFDLSNNFGGFVNMKSALNLVNGASIGRQQAPKLVAGAKQLRKTKSKGTSLLANKPKSYKTIKKEMLQKKHSSLVSKSSSHSQLTTAAARLVNSSAANRTAQTITIEPTRCQPASTPFVHPSTTQITVITTTTTTFAQDHDYCSSTGSPF